MAGKRRERGQQREADQDAQIQDLQSQQMAAPPPPQAAPPPPTAGPSSDTIERLKELGQLHEQGVLTDQEFSEQKAKLLGG
jgi:hypothetical protein